MAATSGASDGGATTALPPLPSSPLQPLATSSRPVSGDSPSLASLIAFFPRPPKTARPTSTEQRDLAPPGKSVEATTGDDMASQRPNSDPPPRAAKRFGMGWLSRSSAPPAQESTSPPNEDSQSARRISTPGSRRLTAIVEDGITVADPNIPPRNPMRGNTPGTTASPQRDTVRSSRWSGRNISRFSEDTDAVPPPSYEWVPNPSEEDTIFNPAEDEKLAELRAGRTAQSSKRRGGWGRILVLLAVALLVIIALAVGLGVGLSQHHHNNNNSDSSSGSSPSGTPSGSNPSQPFPLGSYAIPVTLRNASTDCTSTASTWRCFPYSVGSDVTFNWVISNTSATFASPNTTLTTSTTGVPANLSISSPITVNPFSIIFANQSLTYISPASNASATRLEFVFTMTKTIFPMPPLTSTGAQTQCFFNSTSFLATMYLSSKNNSANANGWPDAVHITQSAVGGANVPNCYETIGGARVNIATEPSSQVCECEYSN